MKGDLWVEGCRAPLLGEELISARSTVVGGHLPPARREEHRRRPLRLLSALVARLSMAGMSTLSPQHRSGRPAGQGLAQSLHLPGLPSHRADTPPGLRVWPGRHLFLQGSSQASRHELIGAAGARKGGTEGKQAGLPRWGHHGPWGSGGGTAGEDGQTLVPL